MKKCGTETADVVTPTLKALNELPWVIAERLHAGKARVRGGWMRFGSAGAPDIFSVICGCAVLFECKNATGKLREAQRSWHERARKAGAFVVVIRSPAEAIEMARKIFRTGGMQT